MTPIRHVCRDCAQPFEIGEDEQRWWQDFGQRTGQAWHWPHRCTDCRALRRRGRLPQTDDDGTDEWRTCVDCGEPFVFGGRDKTYFAAQGFAPPKRCRPCRRQRTAAHVT